MQKTDPNAALKTAIRQLEDEQRTEWPLLKKEFLHTSEKLRLINVFKSTLKEAMGMPGLRSSVINGAIGLTTGVVAKKIILGKTLNPFSKLLGIILEMAVANKVTKNSDAVRSVGRFIMKKLFRQHREAENKL